MSEFNGTCPYIDISSPNPARIHDFLLGGKANFGVDREAAAQLTRATPYMRENARHNRSFLQRAVNQLAVKAGIRQFIDIGSGLPTQGHVHEVAQKVNPDARVVYVDRDPQVVAHARVLLSNQTCSTAIFGDLRRPDTVLAHADLHRLIDLDRPVVLLLIAVLESLADAENPADMVAKLIQTLAPGSYLVISHATADLCPVTEGPHARPYSEIRNLFAGLRLVEPGLVDIRDWRPEGPDHRSIAPTIYYGGIGQKPLPWAEAA
jgi:hypothetical protein